MTSALATVPTTTAAIERYGMTREQLDLLKRTIAKGTTDDEFALFMNTANRLGLDAFAKQIFCVKRYSKKDQREVMSIQVSIDGYRVTATRTGEDDGQDGPYWCGADGKWVDVWLDEKNPPAAAKVLVYRKGRARPYTGVAAYASYVQTDSSGNANAMWSRGPDFMIAKCAEALALRKAFPNELGGTIIPEEAGDEERALAFTTITPPGTPAPAEPTREASNGNTAPQGKPSEPSPKAGPPLSEQDVEDLITAVGKASTVPELRKILKEQINPATKTQEQRDKLQAAYVAQRDMIEAAADQDGAQP
jgi:phage recombination protein Bet